MDGTEPGCPQADLLAAALAGDSLPAAEREALEAHWAACGTCRTAAADLVEAIEEGDGDAVVLRPPRWRVPRVAAAVLLAAAGGAVLVGGGALFRARGVSPVLRGVLDPVAGGGILAAGEVRDVPAGGTVRLDDGTEVAALADAGLSLEVPSGPARLVLGLTRGAVRVTVPPGRGEVLVRGGHGLVRVTGTVFDVRLCGDPLTAGADTTLAEPRLLEVEVRRGSVEIVRGSERFPVAAPGRGYLLPDGRCVRQGVVDPDGTQIEALVARCGRSLVGADGTARALAAAMLRHLGDGAARAVERRAADPAEPEPRRLAWVRVLAALEPRFARPALDRLVADESQPFGVREAAHAAAGGGGR